MTFPLLRAELPANLTAGESAELAARLAALAQSGLPLEGGLVALADEIARPRLARVLRNLAERLERGENLETAIAAQGSRLPADLRGLIVAGVRSGRLPIVLDQFATLARRQQDLRRRVLLTLAYPVLLLGIMVALLVCCRLFVADQFVQVFREYHTEMPAVTNLYLHFSGLIAWTMLGLMIVAMMIPLAAMFMPLGAWLDHVATWIPVLGTIVRYDRHVQFSRLMALLLEEGIPLPNALRLTSIALQGTMLARHCRTAAAAVEGGTRLDHALVAARFPGSLTVMVEWGQENDCLSEAFRAAADGLDSRIDSQSDLLNMLVLPIIYLLIVTFIGFSILALCMPLMSIISVLSSWGAPSSPPSWISVIMSFFGLSGASGGSGLQLVFVTVVLWFGTLAVIIFMACSKRAATQRYAMLALVGAAAERSMPLETTFAAFTHECRGRMRRRTAEIASMLHHGASLPAALEEVPGALPAEAVPLVCVGHENGSLGPAIAQAIAGRNLYASVWQSIVPKLGYVCILPVLAVSIVTGAIRQYKLVYTDLNIGLPNITHELIHGYRGTLLCELLIAFWLLSALLLVYGLLRYAGLIRWDLPGMDWLLRRRHIATVLDALSLAAQGQRPLGAALATLASSYPQRSIKSRLWAAGDDLQAGGDDLQCLHRHGLLGKTDLALLQAARRNGNLAWAAREMADSNRRRFIYRLQSLLQVIFPLVIVGYGLLVGLVVVGMFLPLVDLIRRLTPT